MFRAATAYVVASWLALPSADIVLNALETRPWVMKILMVALVIGPPVAVIVAWVFELTPDGLKRESEHV